MLGLAGLLSALAAYLIVSYVQGLRQENAIAVHGEEIFRSPTSFVAGNPNGNVSIVAFFDYNCPYCREGRTWSQETCPRGRQGSTRAQGASRARAGV
jgi:protein-disulfide isomerase